MILVSGSPLRLLFLFSTWLVLALLACGQRADGQYFPCNPIKNVTCPPNLGLNQWSYFIDFTDPPKDVLDKDWRISNYATITYNTKGARNGAEFTFAKRYDAPQLFSNFYIFFGRVDVEMQVAPGTGIISSSVLVSDDFDEIDWEMSGNDFNLHAQFPNGVVQNNYFPKGITGNGTYEKPPCRIPKSLFLDLSPTFFHLSGSKANVSVYDRGMWVPCTKPQTTFHTYSFDWTPNKLDWLIDGKVVRTFLAKDADMGAHQFPQTPSKLQLGLWAGGDPGQNSGTMNWAGGLTNISAAPFTMFVRNVRITNYNPARYYNYTDQSGSWKSIKASNVSLPSAVPFTTIKSEPLRNDLPLSLNGHCGKAANSICNGSLFGDCCSAYGYCGNTTEFCGLGCQSAFGLCGLQNPAATTGVPLKTGSSTTRASTANTSAPPDVVSTAPGLPTTTKVPTTGFSQPAGVQTTKKTETTSVKPIDQTVISSPPTDHPKPTTTSTSNSPLAPTSTPISVSILPTQSNPPNSKPTTLSSPFPAPNGIKVQPNSQRPNTQLSSQSSQTTQPSQGPQTFQLTQNPQPATAKPGTQANQANQGPQGTTATSAAANQPPTTTTLPSTSTTTKDELKVVQATTSISFPASPTPGKKFCFWWKKWICLNLKRAYPVDMKASGGAEAIEDKD